MTLLGLCRINGSPEGANPEVSKCCLLQRIIVKYIG